MRLARNWKPALCAAREASVNTKGGQQREDFMDRLTNQYLIHTPAIGDYIVFSSLKIKHTCKMTVVMLNSKPDETFFVTHETISGVMQSSERRVVYFEQFQLTYVLPSIFR